MVRRSTAQRSLFERLPIDMDWQPSPPPRLIDYKRVFLDFETDGLRWWSRDRPIGVAVATPDGRSWYLPTRHAGGNLDEDQVKLWMRTELAGKEVGFFNGPFDVNMGYVWGIDFEAMGCRVFDVGHKAALLDDSPGYNSFNSLDALAHRYLNRGKVQGLNKNHMAEYHASEVEEYARVDALLTMELDEVLTPQIEGEQLGRVLRLEDDLIYVTAGMMRQGAPIDEEKLDLWLQTSQSDMVAALWEVVKLTGKRVEVNSRKDILALFEHLNLPPPVWEPGTPKAGEITFGKAKLRRYEHPAIRQLYKARCLASLRSKYLIKYKEELRKYGRLIYALHQLPVDEDGGTRSGRYSSSGYKELDDGINVQQVAGKKQLSTMKDFEDLQGYVIRELYIPAKGKLWCSNDAEQIEYRLFANDAIKFCGSARLRKIYEENPRTDFHNIVWEMLKVAKPDITRELTKDCNFAAIYGAGVNKWSFMMGITEAEARLVYRAYHRQFPEAKQLHRYAMDRAADKGYIRTLLGRRRRFMKGVQSNDALSGRIQGSAADEMKIKMKLLHDHRKETGFVMRFVVHDEANGDVPDAEHGKKVSDLLNQQVLNTIVPLLWKGGTGPNWRECR